MIARAARESEELQNAQDVGSKLENLSLAIAVKTGSGGKLFGSVTSQQIVDKLKEQGFVVDKKHFKNFNPIKALGKIEVHLQLHQEVVVNLTVEVVSENPIGGGVIIHSFGWKRSDSVFIFNQGNIA